MICINQLCTYILFSMKDILLRINKIIYNHQYTFFIYFFGD